MLALTRKKNEGIIINGNIEIKVLDIRDGKVKIGITAPKDVTIHREEVYLEIKENNKEALGVEEKDMENLKKIFSSL